eukprot:COSAG02_NODE_47097_length_343_cov_1.422131_1_plen_36_part_10
MRVGHFPPLSSTTHGTVLHTSIDEWVCSRTRNPQRS